MGEKMPMTPEEREELALRVVTAVTGAFRRLAEARPDIERLWQEFKNLPTRRVWPGYDRAAAHQGQFR